MLKQLKKSIHRLSVCLKKIFPEQTYQHDLDRYITKNRPQNNADVEYLIREYDKNIARKWL